MMLIVQGMVKVNSVKKNNPIIVWVAGRDWIEKR
jgi:hypothetical protein